MNNRELSRKLQYILKELNKNKTEFLKACQVYNPSISKPTILKAINGGNTIAPTIETLSTIIKVCQTSGNEKLKYISYDFLLNDYVQEVEANNSTVYQEIGLSDEVIARLKEFNHPFYHDHGNIINWFFIHAPSKYWQTLECLYRANSIKSEILKIQKRDYKKIEFKTLIKLFKEEKFISYIDQNFHDLYKIYLRINRLYGKLPLIDGTENVKCDLGNLDDSLTILIDFLRYRLLEMNRKMYETM